MDFPPEALVARALSAMNISTTRFYVLCRLYSKYLGPATSATLAADLELADGSVSSTLDRMIDEGLVTRLKGGDTRGQLVLTDAGRSYYLLAFGGVIIPPPEHLRYLHDDHYRTMRKINGRSSYMWTIKNLKLLLARCSSDVIDPILDRFGIRPLKHGNHIVKTSEVDRMTDEEQLSPTQLYEGKLRKRRMAYRRAQAVLKSRGKKQ